MMLRPKRGKKRMNEERECDVQQNRLIHSEIHRVVTLS